MRYPKPTPIFHITPIDNLRSIAETGALMTKNQIRGSKRVVVDISMQSVQRHRGVKNVPVGPRGTLHDYVPFNFAPRSPMLMTLEGGNVAGCAYKQDDIVHIVSTAEQVVAHEQPFVFTNVHAVKAYAEFFADLADLDKIDWEIFFESPRLGGYCKFWHTKLDPPHHAKRMETRAAEFLAYGGVNLDKLLRIAVRTENMALRVGEALAGTDWQPDVEIMPDWYF